MDPSTLAKDLVNTLSPFLPYLVLAGEAAAKEAGQKFGAATWEGAKALWGELWPKVQTKPAAQEAVKDAASSPNDPDAQAALRLQLKELLTEDQALAAEVASLLRKTLVESKLKLGDVQAGAEVTGVKAGTISGNTEVRSDIEADTVSAKITGVSADKIGE